MQLEPLESRQLPSGLGTQAPAALLPPAPASRSAEVAPPPLTQARTEVLITREVPAPPPTTAASRQAPRPVVVLEETVNAPVTGAAASRQAPRSAEIVGTAIAHTSDGSFRSRQTRPGDSAPVADQPPGTAEQAQPAAPAPAQGADMGLPSGPVELAPVTPSGDAPVTPSDADTSTTASGQASLPPSPVAPPVAEPRTPLRLVDGPLAGPQMARPMVVQAGEFRREPDRGDDAPVVILIIHEAPSHEEHEKPLGARAAGLQILPPAFIPLDEVYRASRADSAQAPVLPAPVAPGRAGLAILVGTSHDLEALSVPCRPVPEEVAAAGTEPTLWRTAPARSAWRVPSPQRADLLGEASPADPGPLDLAIGQFLKQLEDVGRDLSHAVGENGLQSWVLAAALVVAAVEGTRRYARRTGSRPALVLGVEQDTLTWIPEAPGGAGSE